ncbi:HtaA domain-containing protein [Actinomadura sp. WMMB 499]|uniref:HtaA domain-containing protein n=1 Tax=Actinomadura sp. WMMB 499 TaxID=1219491 RepID=UPI0020C7CE0C|nr:HtaA domain-containing protein [Actinomadura sp. WMMB 499]
MAGSRRPTGLGRQAAPEDVPPHARPDIVYRDLGLVWGVKSSLLSYLAALPDTEVQVEPGSGRLLDGRFYFSPDPSSAHDGTRGSHRFRGAVRFRAHAGMLDVTVCDPRFETSDEGAWVMSVETWQEGRWTRVPFMDCRLAGADRRDGRAVTRRFATSLSGAARSLFDDTYPAGEPFDDAELRLPPG